MEVKKSTQRKLRIPLHGDNRMAYIVFEKAGAFADKTRDGNEVKGEL